MTWNRSFFLTLLAGVLAGCASTQAPDVTEDGLQRGSDNRFKTVYRLPGSDLTSFETLAMLPCTVDFRENWLRDHNRSRSTTSTRADQDDVDRIKAILGEDCDRYFKEALQENPAYLILDEQADHRGALVIAPGIIELNIIAPDVRSPIQVRSYTSSAGEMTLYLELRDGATGAVLGRIIDRREDPEMQWFEWTTSVSNRADARRILRLWSEWLREYLDENM